MLQIIFRIIRIAVLFNFTSRCWFGQPTKNRLNSFGKKVIHNPKFLFPSDKNCQGFTLTIFSFLLFPKLLRLNLYIAFTISIFQKALQFYFLMIV